MILKVLPLLGIVAVLVISGCTTDPNRIDLKITSIEHKYGTPGYADCIRGGYRNYFLITVENNGEYVNFDPDWNNIQFCSEFQNSGCIGTPYYFCPFQLTIGKGGNETFAIIPRFREFEDPARLYNETGFCGESFRIEMLGRNWVELKTINPASKEKSGWSSYYIVDEVWVTVSC